MAPRRDFHKVANSITREAVPAGLFSGKSKQLYDCLYSLSRGAIVPSRSVRIAKADLMKQAGIGAKVTLDQNIRRLELVGLVAVEQIGGVQGGNLYTVYLPEEIETPASTGTSTGTRGPTPPSGGQKLGPLPLPETTPPSTRLSVDDDGISGDAKTFIKTKEEKLDDEAFAGLRSAMAGATGREVTPAALAELDELLTAEFKLASGRAKSISAPGAFFTEHLRRRLWKKEKEQLEREGKSEVQGSQSKVDASKCPDCYGTGMWYPEGFDRGVARCPHDKLMKEG